MNKCRQTTKRNNLPAQTPKFVWIYWKYARSTTVHLCRCWSSRELIRSTATMKPIPWGELTNFSLYYWSSSPSYKSLENVLHRALRSIQQRSTTDRLRHFFVPPGVLLTDHVTKCQDRKRILMQRISKRFAPFYVASLEHGMNSNITLQFLVKRRFTVLGFSKY